MGGDGTAARGNELVGRAVGVRPEKPYALERQVQLVRHDLHQAGRTSCPQLAAAGEKRGMAIFADGYPGIDLVFRRAIGADIHGGRFIAAQAIGNAEADDEGAGTLQKIAAGKVSAKKCVHGLPLTLPRRV